MKESWNWKRKRMKVVSKILKGIIKKNVESEGGKVEE